MLWSRACRVLTSLPACDLTYAEVGATADASMPPGYRHVDRTWVVGQGRDAFEAAADAVLRWEMHRGADLRVLATTPTAAVGTEVVTGVGLGPLRLLAPCRVVEVVDEPHRRGFAYGTLPGHPERGEERFEVALDGDEVALTIRAFSRPGTWYTRVGGPVGHAVQELVTRRYARAVRGAVARSVRTG